MSVSASIDFSIHPAFSVVELIESLRCYGWSFDDSGGSTFLPVGDDDDYDWQVGIKISELDLIGLLRKKETLGEMVGVRITWSDTGVGGLFLQHNDRQFSLSTDSDRPVTNYGITDFSWYAERMVPPLFRSGFQITSIVFEESR